MVVINRKVLGTICLMIGTFLNPFGFDILVYKLTLLTNDYWNTMYVLYAGAVLLFGLSFLFFKKNKKALGNILITAALFINPLGYDWLVYGISQLTNDYWITMSIMYTMAAFFFGASLYLYNVNPVKFVHGKVKTTSNNIKTKISKNG